MVYNCNDINSMSGVEFEFLCKDLLEKMGFETETTKASGDGGIDLIAYNYQPILSGKYIIQCKRYTGSVGEPIIRDLYGVVSSERANKGILITTGVFTYSAIAFADKKPIELIDGNKLHELLLLYGLDNITTSCNGTNDIHQLLDSSQQYIKSKNIVKKDPLNWDALQDLVHILMQALTSDVWLGHCTPTKSEYDRTIDECVLYLSKLFLYNSPLCKYSVNYCKSVLYFLKGDVRASYDYAQQAIEIISSHVKTGYTEEEIVTITAIVYNQIQLSLILNDGLVAQKLLEKWQHIFDLRISYLKSKMDDDSLDWADPDEDINDILEFMEEENAEYNREIVFLSNPLVISNMYVIDSFITFYNVDLPKDYFQLSLLDDSSIRKIPFEIENHNVVGIQGFPKWIV